MYRILAAHKQAQQFPGTPEKLSDAQKKWRGGWAQTPDFSNTNLGGLTDIRMASNGKTTVTEINPLDPGDNPNSWKSIPSDSGKLKKARKI
jgi:hypothetical protein